MIMTKGERDDLLSLIKKRERVAKSGAEQRSAALLAQFEQNISAVYKFDQDTIWAEAYKTAEAAFSEANAAISKRCDELGIPEEFKPQLYMSWARRGENEFASRRAELRRTAKAEIAELEKAAKSRIEANSAKAQTEILSHGLTSAAAVEFMKTMPSVESLMPAIELTAIERKLADMAKRSIGYRGSYDA